MLRSAALRTLAVYAVLIATPPTLIACHSGKSGESTAPAPDLSLSGLAGQRVVVLPTYTVRLAPELGWNAAVGPLRDVQRALDKEITSALRDRGAMSRWIFPDALQQSYRRNASYSADPYALAEEPLRGASIARSQRVPEPLASQIRTIIALHDDTRLVLAPVELRFERAGTSMGRGYLRLVLVDARSSEVRWFGDVRSDSVASYAPAVLADVASRVADLVAR
jgi:hypothetical protein